MTPVQRELFAATVQERTPWVAPAGLGQRTTGSLSLAAQPFLRTTVKRGGVVYRETTEPLPPGGAEAPVPAAPPEEVVRRPVTEVSFVFQYGAGAQDTVRLTVAPAARS